MQKDGGRWGRQASALRSKDPKKDPKIARTMEKGELEKATVTFSQSTSLHK